MAHKALYLFAILAVVGFASAGVLDWFGAEDDDGEVLSREVRAAPKVGCDIAVMTNISACCNTASIWNLEDMDSCAKAKKSLKSKDASADGVTKKPKKKKQKPASSDGATAEPAKTEAPRSKRAAKKPKKPTACALDCILRKKNIVNADGDLDVKALQAAFGGKADSEIEKCAVSGKLPTLSKDCKSEPTAIVSCVMQKLNAACAVAADAADSNCNDNNETLKNCAPFGKKKENKSRTKKPENA